MWLTERKELKKERAAKGKEKKKKNLLMYNVHLVQLCTALLKY